MAYRCVSKFAGKNPWQEAACPYEVITAVARYLGFTRLRETVRDPIRSAINGAIRRGTACRDGTKLWRS